MADRSALSNEYPVPGQMKAWVLGYGIRGEGQSATHRAMALMKQKRFDASLIHTHTFPLSELPTALRYARERVDDAIKVVVKNQL